MNNEIFGSYEIHSSDSAYTIGANIDFDKSVDRFYMPYLVFRNKKEEEFPLSNLTWDSEDWLLKLHDVLTNKLRKQILTEEEQKFLYEIEETIPQEDFEVVLAMLNKAIGIGMFDDFLNRKK